MNPSEPREAIRLYEQLPELRLRRRTETVVKILSRKAFFSTRYRALIQYADQVHQKIEPFTPCAAGCDACCHMPAFIFEFEAKRMAAASGRRMAQLPVRDHQQVMLNGSRYVQVACPFLQDHRCSIYEQRPLVCRVHHSLAATEEPCRKVSMGGLVPPPMLDPDYAEVPFYLLMNATRPQDPLGAIQEFFPD